MTDPASNEMGLGGAVRVGHAGCAASRLGIALVVFASLVRAMTVTVELPHFDADPRITATPMLDAPATGVGVLDAVLATATGLGPTGGLLLDALALFGAAMVILSNLRRLRGIDAAILLLTGLGTIGTLLHAAWNAPLNGPGDVWIGSAWIAAWWSAAAAWIGARDGVVRRLLLAGLASFALILAGKGLLEVLIDHPQTVETFRANRETELAARGWEPGSASALLYERRLSQPEATGWFGLANVYASVMAGAAVLFAGLLFEAWRTRRQRDGARAAVLCAMGLGSLAAALGLVLSGSKGGAGAAVLGTGAAVGALAAGRFAGMRNLKGIARLLGLIRGSWLALFAVALVLGAVVVRGILGDAIGELSLRFRWFYLIGAGRVFLDHPISGVGPDGFQAAYLLARPALSPEEVTSPHSVLFDWAATLGVFGLAWGGAFVVLLWMGGRGMIERCSEDDRRVETPRVRAHEASSRGRGSLYAVGGVIAAAMVVATLIGRGASVPLGVAGALSTADPIPIWALVAGLLVWIGAGVVWVCMTLIGAGWLGRAERASAWAGGAMIAWAAVSMIDMAPVQPGSASLMLLLIASAAAVALAGAGRGHARDDSPGSRSGSLRGRAILLLAAGMIGALLCAVSAGFAVVRAQQTAAWERSLDEAARMLAPIGRARAEVTRLAREGVRDREIARVVGASIGPVLSATLGEQPSPDLDRLMRQIDRADLIASMGAADLLGETQSSLFAADFRLDRRMAGMLIAAGRIADEQGLVRLRDEAASRAIGAAERPIERAVPGPGPFVHRAAVTLAAAELSSTREPALRDRVLGRARESAIADLERAHELDPYGLGIVVRLMELTFEASEDASLNPETRGERTAEARSWAERALELDTLKRLDPLRGLAVDDRRLAERLAR